MNALAQLPRRAAEWLITVAAAWLVVIGPAAAQDYPPRPEGPVYDGAGILSAATVATLDDRLRDYNRETGRAIVIATIPSLDGAPLEQYATGLYADWGIGGEKRDQGLLLLIARDDRKIRIEVGYGLHPYFGGIMSGRVIRDEMTPRFKQGDFDGGVIAAVDAITAHLAKSPEEAAAVEEAARAAEEQGTGEGGFPIGALFWLLFVFLFFILPMLSRGGRRRRRRRSPWGNTARDIILWEASSAIARGVFNSGGGGGGSWGGGGGGGGFGGFGGGMSGGGGASGGW